MRALRLPDELDNLREQRLASHALGAHDEAPGAVHSGAGDFAAVAVHCDLDRRSLEQLLPTELERWVELAEELRISWKADGVPLADRLRALDT